VREIDAVTAALAEAGKRQQLLLGELDHRVKNIMTVIGALVARTISDGRSPADARQLIQERLQALARAHDVLMHGDWRGAALGQIVAAELAPFSNRLHVSGPHVVLDANVVQTFALILHEPNSQPIAAKYGAFSAEKGTIHIEWAVTGAGEEARFSFRWQERNGPAVTAPTVKGFGHTLLENAGTMTPGTGVKAMTPRTSPLMTQSGTRTGPGAGSTPAPQVGTMTPGTGLKAFLAAPLTQPNTNAQPSAQTQQRDTTSAPANSSAGANAPSPSGTSTVGAVASGGGSTPSGYVACMALWNPAKTSREDWQRTCQQAGLAGH
jgi:two-component sensor histidine kinase